MNRRQKQLAIAHSLSLRLNRMANRNSKAMAKRKDRLKRQNRLRFLKLPMEKRIRILEEQANQIHSYYESLPKDQL